MSGLRRPAVEWRAAVTCNSVCQAKSVSALFLANGTTCRILGFSEQWAAPRPRHPFRYGGAAAPGSSRAGHGRSTVPRGARALGSHRAARSVQRRFPGRSGRLSPAGDQSPAGCDAGSVCSARPVPCAPIRLPGRSDSHAPRVTRRQSQRHCLCPPPDRRCRPGFDWPGWAADRQPAGVPVPTHAPFCTVHADAPRTDAARALAGERIELILRLAEAAQ